METPRVASEVAPVITPCKTEKPADSIQGTPSTACEESPVKAEDADAGASPEGKKKKKRNNKKKVIALGAAPTVDSVAASVASMPPKGGKGKGKGKGFGKKGEFCEKGKGGKKGFGKKGGKKGVCPAEEAAEKTTVSGEEAAENKAEESAENAEASSATEEGAAAPANREKTIGELNEEYAKENERQRPDYKPWNPQNFAGEFRDTLGNWVTSICDSTNPKRLVFTVTMQKSYDQPPRQLVVRQVYGYNGYRRWMCGNGYFQRQTSSHDKIIWQTVDGRESTWTRTIPDGPVYFDPPPFLMAQAEAPKTERCTYVVNEEAAAESSNEEVAEEEEDEQKMERHTPKLKDETRENCVEISPGSLEWTVGEKMSKLRSLPADFAVNSPMFSVHNIDDMQLLFLPGGRKATDKASESGEKTSVINLMTGNLKSGTGIKFEITLNGVRTGPKVCLGKRFCCEFPSPFANKQSPKEVVIGFRVLDIFREGSIL